MSENDRSGTDGTGWVHERIAHSYFDQEQLLEIIRTARLDHRLTSGPRFGVAVERVVAAWPHADPMTISRGRYEMPVLVTGEFSPDTICLGRVAGHSASVLINGQNVTHAEIQVYAEGCEAQYSANGATAWSGTCVRRDELQTLAIALIGRTLPLDARGMRNLRVSRVAATRIDEMLQTMLRTVSESQMPGAPREMGTAVSVVREQLLSAYILALSEAHDVKRLRTNGRKRFDAMNRVLSCLDLEDDLPFSLVRLSQDSGVPPRTLQVMFRDYYGLSPRSYVLNERLHRARRDLLANKAAVRGITSVAMRYGFFHLGRFAALYRRLFGELPYETARRAAALTADRLGS